MSVNKVNKTTGDLSLLAGANNITNTTGVAELSALANIGTSANATQHAVNEAIDHAIYVDELAIGNNATDITNLRNQLGTLDTEDITESSALSNIGTVANATQHEVNVAIDGVIEDIIKWETLDTSGVWLSQSGAQFSRLNVKKNKMLFVVEGEINNATLTISSTTTLTIRLPNNYPSLGMYAVGALQFWVGESNEASGYAFYIGGNGIFLFSNSDNDPVSGATLRFSIIVPLANS